VPRILPIPTMYIVRIPFDVVTWSMTSSQGQLFARPPPSARAVFPSEKSMGEGDPQATGTAIPTENGGTGGDVEGGSEKEPVGAVISSFTVRLRTYDCVTGFFLSNPHFAGADIYTAAVATDTLNIYDRRRAGSRF